MESVPHLQPVAAPPTAPPPENGETKRSKSRSRPSRPIMTDRIRQDVQENILTTLGRLSGPQRRPVSGDELAEATGLYVDTARLPLPFFKEAGFLEKSGRSDFMATPALLEFLRLRSVGKSHDEAVASLRDAMRSTWYWTEVEPVLAFGAVPKGDVIATLSRAAGASTHHNEMIENTIFWLSWVRLLIVADGKIRKVLTPKGSPTDTAPEPTPTEKPTTDVVADPADPAMPESTTTVNQTGDNSGYVVNMTVTLTREQFAALSADQLAALHTIASLPTG